jgi:antitoxin component YwqK of YwqJK toxin-antitoxin module
MVKFVFLIIFILGSFSYIFAQNVGEKSADTTQLINYTDIQGNRQGKWHRKFASGKTAFTGYFVNNILIGDYKKYYESGILKAYIKYNKTGSVGYATLYWDNNKKMADGKYINQNIKDSIWNYYGTDGVIKALETYKSGIKNGACKSFYPSGKQLAVITYKEGKKNGIWKTFYEDGVSRFETFHINDKRHGSFIVHFENGKTYLKGNYKEDRPDGKWIKYNNDGTISKEMEYVNGKLIDQDKYDEEFQKQMKEWEGMKGKIPEPNEGDFYKGGSNKGSNFE